MRLSVALLSGAAALILTACQTEALAGADPLDEIESEQVEITRTEARPDDTQFADVLEEYRALNARLHRVAARLRLANAALCPKTERDPGFLTHTLADYPVPLQAMAQAVMGLDAEGVFIRSVRPDSPAARAGIEDGDQIIAINGRTLPEGYNRASFYGALSRNAFNGADVAIALRPQNGPDYTTRLKAQTACDIPVNVIYSDHVNGHTDGKEVLITSELMQTVPDDINLALITAHEMAHAIAHNGKTPSKALELQADRMALVLMANAGYNIEAAVAQWQVAADQGEDSLDGPGITHPRVKERADNFEAERKRIRAAQEAARKAKPEARWIRIGFSEAP